jgi:hypothetical protein
MSQRAASSGRSQRAASFRSKIVELSQLEAEEAFDAVARREMGISGAEFLRRWDAGYYEGQSMDDVKGLVETWMAVGLVR